METAYNYWLIWLLYTLAAGGFYLICWWLTRLLSARWLSCSLRALLLALMLTPWYANADGSSLAPALMIVMLDAITIGPDAAGRALVPLLLALFVAELLASLYWFRSSRRKH